MSLSKIFNDYLFAPSRYLTQSGNIVGAGRLRNIFLAPQTKIAALTTVGLSVIFAAAGSQDWSDAALGSAISMILGTALGCASQRKKEFVPENGVTYYFDTAPEKRRPIAKEIQSDLQRQPAESLSMMIPGLGINGAFFLFNYFLLNTGIEISTTFAATLFAQDLTKCVASIWNAQQALNGNWNVVPQQYEPEEKTANAGNFTFVPAA